MEDAITNVNAINSITSLREASLREAKIKARFDKSNL